MNLSGISLICLICLTFHLASTANSQPVKESSPKPYLVDYRASVTEADLQGWPLAIVHPSARLDLPQIQTGGTKVLAYLSVVEVASHAPHLKDLKERGILPVGKNEEWESGVMDVQDPRWTEYVVEQLVPPLVERGYDGLFLDTVDSYAFLVEKTPDEAEAIRGSMVEMIQAIRAAFPRGQIVMNRGFPLLESLSGVVDGLLVESVFQSVDLSNQRYFSVEPAVSEQLLTEMDRARSLGYEGFILDYVSPRDESLARDTARRIEAEGFRALVSTPDLMGQSLAPWRPVARNMLVLYGQMKDAVGLEFPMDTYTYRAWQTSLEWLGFELEYRSLLNEGLPENLASPALHGLIIDRGLVVPAQMQLAFWELIKDTIDRGKKVFFCGALPPVPESVRPWLEAELGLEGTFQPVLVTDSPRLSLYGPARPGFEVRPGIVPRALMDIRISGAQADVWLRADGTNVMGQEVRMDGAFVADWGGAILRPFAASNDPLERLLLYVDPLKLGAAILDKPPSPVPDTTSAEGSRVFYSHIDGDGFMNGSEVLPGQYSGEVIRDRILKAYPLPVTASFVTGELKGQAFEPTFGSMERIVKTARDIVALPNIETASHTKSHPYYWSLLDPQASLYNFQSLDLSDASYSFGGTEFEAEIVDSVDYINETFFDGAPKCELLLWSGNCRPPPEALEVAAKADILTMNGGDTLITSAAPFRSMIAPRSVAWRGQVQVFAANQNENVFNNAFKDGLYGGFSNVIQSFELTESPIRFKPVNVYYHFYSADRPASFRELKRVLEWVMRQDLFPLKATEYVRSVLAARKARIFSCDGGFRLIADPGLRTWRYPVAMGYPDMERSTGVLGYNDVGDQRYLIREPGQPIDLVLQAEPPQGPFIRSSTIPYRLEKTGAGWTFYASGWRRGTVVIDNAGRLGTPVLAEGADYLLTSGGTGKLTMEPGMVVDFSGVVEGAQP